jgi:hypothetical protein
MNVETPERLANAVAGMREHVKGFGDQGRWIVPRSGAIVVLDQVNKEASLVLGLPPPSTQKVFEAMGWRWTDRTTVESNREPILVTRNEPAPDAAATRVRPGLHRTLPAFKRPVEGPARQMMLL